MSNGDWGQSQRPRGTGPVRGIRTMDVNAPGGGSGGSALRILGTASCNQAHCKFGRFAGIQCVSNCVLYLVKSFLAGRPLTSRPELDEVLDEGARLDALMRQSGILKGHEMAQLTDVPSSVVLRGGGRVHIYRSAEIFGLVLFPAQIANSAVVQSLAEVLHGSYNGVAQFILYICDIYAGAIIIETDGSFYLFDPHCQKDAAPGTPAHVRVSTYAHDILQYVGAPGAQYTCVHLYFLPEAFETEDPRIFMLEHYGVYDFYEANGSGFDLVGPELVSSDGEAAGTPGADSSPPVMLPFERRIIPYNLRPLPSRSFTSDSFPAARYSPAKTNSPPSSPASAAPASAAPASAAPASAAPASAAPASAAPASAAPASAAPASSPPLFIPIPGLGHTPGVPAPSTPPRASGGAAPQTPKRKKGLGKDSPHKKPTSGRRLPLSSTTDTEDDQLPRTHVPPHRPPSAARLPPPVIPIPHQSPPASPTPHPAPVSTIAPSVTPSPRLPLQIPIPLPQAAPSNPKIPLTTPSPSPTAAAAPTTTTLSPPPTQQQPPQSAAPAPSPLLPQQQPTPSATPAPSPLLPQQQPPPSAARAPSPLPPQQQPLPSATPAPPPAQQIPPSATTLEPEKNHPPAADRAGTEISPSPPFGQQPSFGEDASGGAGLVRYLSDLEEPFLSMSDSEEAESDLASDIPTTEDEDMFEDEVFSNSLESGSSAPTSPITLDTARSQYYQTTFDIETPEMDFVPLESNIARIAGHTYQEQAIVYDPASNREVPEADALSMIDYLLVTVVLEQGLIRSRDRSAVLNLLEFLKDWSGHLQVPTLDLEQLLTSELNIQNLANMLSENKGRAGEFHEHLAAKLEACLPSLATKDAVRVDAGAKMLAEIPQLAESDDGKFDLEAARRRLTDLLSGGDQEGGEGGGEPEDNSIYRGPHVDVPLVLDDESWKRLLSLAEAARTAVARQQAGVDEEDVRFLALLTAIEYGAPPAASVPPFVHNVAVRSKNAALHVRRCTADIRDKVASAASDYLSYLEDPSLPTVMDFDDLLTHLRHTCQIIASLPLLNIRYTSIEWDYRELLYLGTALSDMSGIPWPLERVEEDDPSIAPLPEFETVAKKQKELETTRENEKRLRTILDDIEAMLGLAGVASAPGAPISPASPSATPANHDNPEATPPLADTAALTIPVIEKYIANAGSIVGAAKNPTYIRLRDTIQQIVRSKKYLMNILKSITFYTIDNYIASFEESIDHLYRDLPVLDPEVQDGIDRILDPMVSEALHTFEMGNRLTLEPARLVALQNFATHSTLKETAAAVNLLPGLLAVYDATVTGQAPEDALRLLSGLQNQLSQTLIPGKLKKRFLSYLQKLKNNNNDQLRQKEVQAWRLEAEGFKPATEEQLEAFLDTAPNKELKRQYEKKLRQLMETGRKEKEKLREQEDKERRERRAREANEAWARIRKALGARPEPAPTSPDDWNTLLASLLPDNTDSAAAAAAAVARNTDILDSLTQILAAMLLGITRVRRERLQSLLVDDGGAAERMEAAEPGWFTEIETGPLARLDAWPATPAATAKEGGGGRGAEEAAGALFRARTAADAIRSALAQTRQALQSPDMKSAVVNTDLEAPYAEYERGLAGLLEKRRSAEAALTAIVSEYVDRTLPEATNDPGQANLPPPPTIPQATAPPRLASDSALWPKKPQLLTRRERDDLLQATGDFFSELLTEAEAAEVRALEEQVRESQTLMAKAHEMAASTRRGFHTALEAVLSRSRDEAPDDELRSLLPSPPKAPVQAPLEAALARAAAGNGSWPYRKSLAAAKWIRGICEAVRGLSEGALALAGGVGAWLNLAAAADGEIHELTRLLEVEGMAQNSMDGMEELRLALATLDPKRVAGGKETFADWKRRLSRLEAIIQEAQEESQLQGTLQDLVTQARGHTDPRQLKIVVEAARGLALGASAGSQYALLKDKLLRYASAKQSFLAFYETAQPTVFVKHPLTNNLPLLITISAPPTGWGNGAPTRRAQFLAAAGPAKYAGTLWLETESPCDPLNPAYVSADTQEPLNYIPVYHNFLEYVMPTVLENPEAFSLTPAGRPQAIGPPQDDQERRRRTLASVASARLSAAAADSYWDTWPDVESNAGELLREYVSAPKALMEDLADNPIVAMTLLAHASLIASRNHPPYPAPATDREVILLEQREIMALLVGTHPAYAAAFLGAPSFYAGLGLVSALARDGGLGDLLSDSVLTYRLVRSPASGRGGMPSTTRGSDDGEDARRLTRHRIAGPPTGFIFFQDAWEEMDTRAALWPHPEFLGLVHNQSTARARACMLLLARRCFAPEALQQLWHSLRPLEGPVAFQDYLRDFVKQAYTRGEELPRAEGLEVPRETPSSYGTVTGRALRNLMPYGTPITGPKRGSGDTIPVSVFEAAVAAAFLGRPLTLFVSSQYLFNLKTLGQVRVVAPLLYCDGHSEPFRSLVETISLNFLQDLDGYSESFEPEMSIFARQAVWLRELLTEARAAKPKEARPPTVAILANRKNIIWKCFTYRHNLPNVQFYFNAAGASRWPTDVLNPSFYEHEDPPLPVGYQLPPNPRNVQELFSGFPPRVGHGLVSGDGFQSADNTPASSDRLQQLGGGETDQGEKGSTTAESEASGPPSPQSPLLEKVAPGRPRDWLSPTSSPRDVTVTPGLAAPITLPGPRLMARPYFGAETRASESPDRSPGRSPRPWPKDSLELLPQPAPQQPPSNPWASEQGPIVYTLSPHSTPSTASGSQKKHTIQIPGLVPSQKPSYSPSAPYKPGQSTGGIAPTPSAASLTTFGLQPQDTQASSQDPPYGHSIMQREKKQQGGREEAAEIRPSATRLPTAVGLRPRAPVVAAGAAASATPAFDPGEAPSGLPIPQAPALGSGLAAPAHTPVGALAPSPQKTQAQRPQDAAALPTPTIKAVGARPVPKATGALAAGARPRGQPTAAPPSAASPPRVSLPVRSRQQQSPAIPLPPMHSGSEPGARPEVRLSQYRHAGPQTYTVQKEAPPSAASQLPKMPKCKDSMYYPPSGSARYPAPFEALSFSQSVASPAPSSDQTTLLWNTPSVVTQFLSIEDIIREVVTGGSTSGDLVVPSGSPSSLSTAAPEQDLRYSLTLSQASRVLSRFVSQLRRKLERSTHRLIADLERLKFLYL
ncbi:UNVERIFIED_ASMBLY: large tegument protein [human gammaherpesvirus 4]|nr:large tegument protein [human gammaherpesvirus 4]